jgi:hypothetical protein
VCCTYFNLKKSRGKRKSDISRPDPKILNNSVTFSGKPMGSEEFLNRMIETLDINI